MENAAKALLIAAGVLIGLILISMMVISHREISSYYEEKEQAEISEQVHKFNMQFAPYDRENVRGTDLISLVNKIIDYNQLQEDDLITISIRIPGDSDVKAKSFYYNYSLNKNIGLLTLGKTYDADTFKEEILDVAIGDIERRYPRGLANELANNLYKITEADLEIKKAYLKTLNLDVSDVNNSDILRYYQYVQLKRAHFDCESLTYGDDGRVERFIFEFNGKFE